MGEIWGIMDEWILVCHTRGAMRVGFRNSGRRGPPGLDSSNLQNSSVIILAISSAAKSRSYTICCLPLSAGPKMGRLFLETGMLATGQRFRLGTALTVWPASSPEAGIGSQNTTYTVELLQDEGTQIRWLFRRHIG